MEVLHMARGVQRRRSVLDPTTMAANMDGLAFLNYSRPIIAPVASPPPRPVRSPDRARTDDERPRQVKRCLCCSLE